MLAESGGGRSAHTLVNKRSNGSGQEPCRCRAVEEADHQEEEEEQDNSRERRRGIAGTPHQLCGLRRRGIATTGREAAWVWCVACLALLVVASSESQALYL